MQPYLQLRPLRAADWRLYRELRLGALADSPDAYGSTLAAEQDRPDAVWVERLALAESSGKDLPLLAEQDGQAIGLVWAKVDAADAAVVNLFQMWVAPQARGRGVGQALLRRAVEWAASTGARWVQLGVTCGDTAAVRLYGREGFSVYGEAEPLRAGSSLMAQMMHLRLAGR